LHHDGVKLRDTSAEKKHLLPLPVSLLLKPFYLGLKV
jgi:hypothetical protein